MTKNGPERDVYFALKRMYQLEKMKELNGPAELIEGLTAQLRESYEKLGDDLWEQVHKQYPEFKETIRREEARDNAWDAACKSCEHWDGSGDDDMNDTWCSLYERKDITRPMPCPRIRLKVIN